MARSCTTTTTPTPTSAKLSVKPHEFDIGWAYIRALELLGMARVRKTPPRLKLGAPKPVADSQTLEALIANRYEVMAKYATELRAACGAELDRLKAQGAQDTARWMDMRLAKAWLRRDDDKNPQAVKPQLAKALRDSFRPNRKSIAYLRLYEFVSSAQAGDATHPVWAAR